MKFFEVMVSIRCKLDLRCWSGQLTPKKLAVISCSVTAKLFKSEWVLVSFELAMLPVRLIATPKLVLQFLRLVDVRFDVLLRRQGCNGSSMGIL